MKTTNGNTAVQGGYYFNKANWEIHPVKNDGDVLPAGQWVQIPVALAIALMPALGGLMVVFLPFIGLYLAAKTAVGGVTGAFNRSAQDLAATITPGWAPGAAHMTGKATEEKKAEGEKTEDAKLAELAKEVDEKRNA